MLIKERTGINKEVETAVVATDLGGSKTSDIDK